jgi:DNA repair protein RadC
MDCTTSTSGIPSVFSTHESALISTAMSLIEDKRLKNAPLMNGTQDFANYMRLRFAGLANEQGHVLYLNINRQLIAAETEFYGGQSSVMWDMRKVVGRAINIGAEFLVFAHNHPNENPTPSDADVQHMVWAEKMLMTLGLTLLDDLVVTSRGITSIRQYRDQMVEIADQKRLLENREWKERQAKERAERKAARMAERTKKMAAIFGEVTTPLAA